MGAFTNNEAFLAKFMAAARVAGEKAWQLPMDEEYKEYLKSAFADLPNIGGRHGGSITAAWFLREFADPTPWIHLDIASTAWLDDGKAWLSKGPSGVAVRSFVQLALDWTSRLKSAYFHCLNSVAVYLSFGPRRTEYATSSSGICSGRR